MQAMVTRKCLFVVLLSPIIGYYSQTPVEASERGQPDTIFARISAGGCSVTGTAQQHAHHILRNGQTECALHRDVRLSAVGSHQHIIQAQW